MKRWTRAALAAALCAALLLSGLMLPGLGSASSVYLMAANDQVVEMTAVGNHQIQGSLSFV